MWQPRPIDASLFRAAVADLALDARWEALLARAIAEEPSSVVREGGVIATGFDAELDELRAIDANCGEFLVALEARERGRTGIASLKVEYNRVHGFYIEVTNAHVEKIPEDYRRRQTLKNAERYITPELKAFEDKALSAQERALAREKLLFERVLDELAPAIASLQQAAAALATLDVLANLAQRADALNLVRPAFVAAPGITIRGGRHPVVERQVESFIPNDVALAQDRRLLIVTGPNMGGKSTYMRQVAVIALLAYCGIYVPAASATLGPLDAIYTRIGASDDLAGGRSTFMVEMTEAAYILNRATPESLVLIDEIGRGTSTFDGLALAWAIAHRLAERNRCLSLFATHYFELTALAAELEGCANVHFDAAEHKDGIVFLHAVADGPANRSYGLQVAKLAGVPAETVRQAKAYLGRLDQFSARNASQDDLFGSHALPGNAGPGHRQPARRGSAGAAAGARPGLAIAARSAGSPLRAEETRRTLKISVVVMTACAMGMAVGNFLGRGRPDLEHGAIEAQALSGELVIAIEHCLAVGDAGDAPDHLGAIQFGNQVTTDGDVGRQVSHGFQADHLGIVFAKGIHRLQGDGDGVAHRLPGQRLLDLGEDTRMGSVQVDNRLG